MTLIPVQQLRIFPQISATMATQMSRNWKFGADGVIYAELNKVGCVEGLPECLALLTCCAIQSRINNYDIDFSICCREHESTNHALKYCAQVRAGYLRYSQIMEGKCRDYGEVLSYAIKTNAEAAEAGNSKPGFCCAAAVGSGKAAVSWTTYAGILKVNVDAGFVGDFGFGLGAVIRDGFGAVMAARVQQGSENWDVRVAEAKAVW